MNRIAASIVVLMLMALCPASGAQAAVETRPPTPEEKNFYTSVVLPAMLTVKTSMPPAPQSWATRCCPQSSSRCMIGRATITGE